MNDNVVFALVLIGMVVLTIVAMLIVMSLSKRAENKPPAILQAGPFEWTVYIQGSRETWNLSYRDLRSLPFGPEDFQRVIVFRGKRYKLWRAWEGQFQVSSPIN